MSPSTIFLDEIDAIISQRVEARSEHEASKRLKTELLIQACNSHSVTYVPLYDTLGPNAVEFIINHAQVSIAFVQENNIPSILSCLGQCSSNLITIVSFGNVSTVQKKEAEEHGTSCFSWEEFLQLDVRYLIEDVQVLKLTIFCGVPRVFDRVYADSDDSKLGYLDKGLPQDKAAPFFDRLVFDKKAATKRMDMQASKEFLAELKVLTHVHHLNLV
ncbi:hypothetical protein AHAS_Ahas12G0144100 [Arachis hypogaea]